MEYFDFTETIEFERKALKLIGDDEISELQLYLCQFPEQGAVIPNSNGLRELRWASSGRGKRGGARINYYFAVGRGRILLLDIYAKNEKEDLTFEELKILKDIMEAWLVRK
jgi:mRNA-degrading endonuclease RelE of RelBE toxin-antitoxin system